MNARKCALGLVAVVAVAGGLASCDRPSYNPNGAIFTYTDAQGNRVSYTAEDLMNYYQQSGDSLSTEFDCVYEVLIRNYYQDPSQASVLSDLQDQATQQVIEDKQTATNNSRNNNTSYEEEFETILNNAGVKNVDELYQYHLYNLEQERFQEDIYQNFGTGDSNVNGLDAMRDGTYVQNGETKVSFPESEQWGIGDDGWLKEQMPYHIRHILVQLDSATSNAYTQDKIGESSTPGEGGETTTLANVILALAGANTSDITPLSRRWDFGTVAQQYSDDTSASNFGEINLMTKVMGENDLVPEFKLGIYAYESLYNQRNSETKYGKENLYRIAPGLREDAEYDVAGNSEAITSDMIDTTQTIHNGNEEVTVYDYFNDLGIGQIPFGAAVALLEMADITTDANGNPVNESNDAFFPRNVIYNKYFNKHNVCVITPNVIQTNSISNILSEETKAVAANVTNDIAGNHVTGEDYVGLPAEQFENLPGFQIDTTNVLPQFTHNVLTDSEGQIVLAVRAGTSSYQGIHFIVVQRSALSQYGLSPVHGTDPITENVAEVNDQNIATLSEYYTTATPSMSRYPTYTEGDENVPMTTYVNYNTQTTSSFNTRANTVSDDIRGYNDNLSTYQFQRLVEDGNIVFANQKIESEMETYVQTSRMKTSNSNFETWSDNWTSYAEMIASQEQARAQGADTMTGSLISEIAALDYSNPNKSTGEYASLWNVGGSLYYSTRGND